MTVRERIRAFGDAQTLEAYDGALAAYVAHHEREPYADLRVEREIAYGADARQRLDIFLPADRAVANRPLLVFAHGGGFVRGDKRMPGAPYYDNVGVWAVRHGFIGVTINYRLAPANQWPAGPDDVAGVVAWVAARAVHFGADVGRVYLMGHSAGAAHIGSYLSRRDAGEYPPFDLRGAILMSGLYDILAAEQSEGLIAYYGADAGRRRTASSLAGLAQTATPLLVVNAELDARTFHEQGSLLLAARFSQQGRLPACVCLPDHGHLSEIAHLNASDDLLGAAILAFTAG